MNDHDDFLLYMNVKKNYLFVSSLKNLQPLS
jgi:hypothetical protein